MRQMCRTIYAAVLFACACVIGCGDESDRAEIRVGVAAPSFSLTTGEHTIVSNRSLEGEIVVLNFWSTTCTSCVRELADLQEIAASGKAKVIGVALDEDGWRSVQPFLQTHPITFPIGLGDESLFARFGGYGIPYTLVLDRTQRIARIHRGPVTKQLLEEEIHALDEKI